MTIYFILVFFRDLMVSIRTVQEEAGKFQFCLLKTKEQYLIYKRWHNRVFPVYLRLPKRKNRKKKEE